MALRVAVCAITLMLLFPPALNVEAQRSPKPAALVGEVDSIHRGLGVQRPGDRMRPGRVRQGLYAQYRAQTQHEQLASLIFRDRSILHMNQDTDLTLRSSNLTYVQRGEVNQVVAPGTSHRLQTATAVASAIGSDFLVDVTGKGTLVATREGSVLVFNQYGYVYVKTGQATTVTAGKPPQAPGPYNVSGALAWRNALLSGTPALDTNLALDANGGHVIALSSEQPTTRSERAGLAAYAIDGRLDRGWSSLSGNPSGQWIKLGFATPGTYSISSVAISTGPLGLHPPRQSLKDFTIRASTTGTADGDFTPVYSGKIKQEARLQRFVFPAPITAKYVELYVVDNYGDPQQTIVSEVEIVGHLVRSGTSQPSGTCDFLHQCMQKMLNLINDQRAAHHVPPLQLNDTLSTGNSTCVGAYGHTVAMAQSGQIWHRNPRYPQASFDADSCSFKQPFENIAQMPPTDQIKSLSGIVNLWMRDYRPGQKCTLNNHACHILDPANTQVGVGLYFDARGTWATAIFAH